MNSPAEPRPEQQIIELEIRMGYLEAAVEELTDTSLQQQKVIRDLEDQITRLKSLLADAAPAAVRPASEDTPPPHY